MTMPRELGERRGPRHDAGGFTLVEVLVSLVVLSAGLLALAQVFSHSAQASNGSYVRTIAHVQALDMGERMWLNLADPVSQEASWAEDHGSAFPGWRGTLEGPDGDGLYKIVVRWEGGAHYEYELLLPAVQVTP